jgi:cellulose synthase/poly-beta-1,6-N-acetylglucosamine synthase-like glycosyltransferase
MLMTFYNIFCIVVFSYSLLLMISYVTLVFMSRQAQNRLHVNMPDDESIKYMMQGSPLTPAVSIIAPAFNEEVTIIDNVNSLLQIDYPDYEIIIVNDESTDRTMELLINEYHLVEVPYDIAMRVPSKPIKRVLKSTDERYSKLIVVDKAHGGRKADGSNAGINVCSNKYFVCTDVDCIIEPMALYRMMWLVINSHKPVIGVGATMLMSNGCLVEDGRVAEPMVPNKLFPMFQQLEYLRSFFIGKLGWSYINALPNISGGFGLFDTDIAVKSGGYDTMSMAEDVDIMLRMVTYMNNNGFEYCLAQVPKVCCWTEGPSNLKSLTRQRIRWARGLFEIVINHSNLFFNPSYGVIGGIMLPYIFIFEFIAPILELLGIIFLVYFTVKGGVNWNTSTIVFSMVYAFSLFMTTFVILSDNKNKAVNWKHKKISYLKLIVATFIEPFMYHPIVTYSSLTGYWRFIRNKAAVWAPIQRTGVKKKK